MTTGRVADRGPGYGTGGLYYWGMPGYFPGWAFLEHVGPNLRVPCEWPVLLAGHARGDDPSRWIAWARNETNEVPK